MPISNHLLQEHYNLCVIVPAWATIGDWLDIVAATSKATSLIDFGTNPPLMRAGVTSLNWYLMDLLGLRAQWYDDGWLQRDEVWLLINPLRYKLLGHSARRPFAHDVRDYLMKLAPYLLRETLDQHAYFAMAPTIYRHEYDDGEAERLAAQAPWGHLAVLDDADEIVGMVWAPGPMTGTLPPILKHPHSVGSVTYC